MRIGVFTYGMDGERMTGIARYAVELTRALRALDPTLEIILVTPYPQSRHPWYQEFETYPVPRLARLPFAATVGNWYLHRAAVDLRLDVLHDPCGIAPFLVPTTRYCRVTTVHDAIPYLYPTSQPLLTRLVFQTLIRATRFTADAVLTVSASAASDLARLVPLPIDKLHVTPNGVTWPPQTASEDRGRTLERLGVRSPYLLSVGALHPRKNMDRVLAAFQRTRADGTEAHLVIAGPPSWGAHGTLQSVHDHVRADAGVVFTGFVSDDDLHELYFGATALVFPSLYEGFGLPVLEAMVHGTPVISSTVSALPEVVGDAGILVDPTSTEEIADAMRRVVADSDLRADLRRRGFARARHFDWLRTAERTLDVYRRVTAIADRRRQRA